MTIQAITTTVLSHPLQVLLMGMIALHGVRTVLSAVRRADGLATGHLDLRAAA